MTLTRREIVAGTAAVTASAVSNRPAAAQSGQGSGVQPEDRVFICNEDSNTLAVINPRTNTVETAVNLTSFRRRPAPSFPFRHRRGRADPCRHGPEAALPRCDLDPWRGAVA